MIGGRVQQLIASKHGTVRVEVLDEQNFERCWLGLVEPSTMPHDGDRIWWQDGTAFLTRTEPAYGCELFDLKIGDCYPSAAPQRERKS